MASAVSLRHCCAELTSKIRERPPEFVATHPDVPWSKIRGFRNQLAHDYFSLES